MKLCRRLVVGSWGLIAVQSLWALTIKVGVVVPDGTSWALNLQQLSNEVAVKTAQRVDLRIYTGGVLGDEPDVLRKIRINQIHGGIFTAKTLGEIHGDIRVMELPFAFRQDRVLAWNCLQHFAPLFNHTLTNKGFKNLGFFEIGMIYFVSQKKIIKLEEFKGIKIWAWEGDQLGQAMLQAMNLVGVSLPLTEVLSSLSTGIISAAYASPMAILALQWHGRVKYVVDFPIAYSIGAFLIQQKQWEKVSLPDQKIVEELAAKYLQQMNETTVAENQQAIGIMQSMGLEFSPFDPLDVEKGIKVREQVENKLKGNLISAAILEEFQKFIVENSSIKSGGISP